MIEQTTRPPAAPARKVMTPSDVDLLVERAARTPIGPSPLNPEETIRQAAYAGRLYLYHARASEPAVVVVVDGDGVPLRTFRVSFGLAPDDVSGDSPPERVELVAVVDNVRSVHDEALRVIREAASALNTPAALSVASSAESWLRAPPRESPPDFARAAHAIRAVSQHSASAEKADAACRLANAALALTSAAYETGMAHLKDALA